MDLIPSCSWDLPTEECSSKKTVKCEVCQRHFASKRTVKVHMLTHTGERPFQCNLCDKNFIRKRDLQNHLMRHAGETPFKCPVCARGFIQKCDMKKHQITHLSPGLRPYQCLDCDKAFTQDRYLMMHIKNMHEKKPMFECRICKATFSTKFSLMRHFRKFEKNEKSFENEFIVFLHLASSS